MNQYQIVSEDSTGCTIANSGALIAFERKKADAERLVSLLNDAYSLGQQASEGKLAEAVRMAHANIEILHDRIESNVSTGLGFVTQELRAIRNDLCNALPKGSK